MAERLTITSVDPSVALALVPAVHSKAQTVKDIAYHIRVYPSQKPIGDPGDYVVHLPEGAPVDPAEAQKQIMQHVENHVLEFAVQGETAVGTLHEIQKFYGNLTTFFIYPRQGNGLLLVVCRNGVFEIEDGMGDGWDIQ